MWIKAILASGLLAAAAMPLLMPAATSAPQPVPQARSTSDTPFAAICRDGQFPQSRPDPAWVTASFNGDGCRLAPVPAALDGTTVPREAVVAAMAEAKRYEAAAAAFRQCVGTYAAAHTLTPAQRIIENHRILIARQAGELAAAQVLTAIQDFNMYGIDCSG